MPREKKKPRLHQLYEQYLINLKYPKQDIKEAASQVGSLITVTDSDISVTRRLNICPKIGLNINYAGKPVPLLTLRDPETQELTYWGPLTSAKVERRLRKMRQGTYTGGR